ncbi:amino acid ABC transporter permease [Paracoccus shanxieyensis]|uniref:ABC transporter permease subunit n=1 Tax=Paracoccus shanxieyensis TaxID=2675752 RepID=A0A6L6IWX7_9RHOB|nr:amino acid ABC transporter permease [Paracoccus shanxieyensis]MTH64131.1 ABC transporter permease subunit [Paracoccus shanxieyensis]MTH87275.1 ABC transporter permease subunit [Paracoccus shanxieyensis]
MTVSQIKRPSNGWRQIRRDYFGSVGSGLLTVGSFALLGSLAWMLIRWGLLDATFAPEARHDTCQAAGGACWSVIANRWRLILFGLYPYDEQWRSALACVIVVATVAASCFPRFWNVRALSLIWILGAVTFFMLMRGGVFGLRPVTADQWGGLSLTLMIFVGTVLVGMPLSIMLALMRRSEMPVIARATGFFIDAVRSLPVITILFTFAIFLPFVLPAFLQGEKLYRVILALGLFFAAYQAEIIRGGLQGVAAGQDEAAKALGLSYRYRVSRILLPQAFRNALPATINQMVIAFMETSMVVIIGFFELLASGNAAYGTGEWSFAFVEVYVFISAIYFTFVFGLSRYGAFLERRMNTGRH